jgi:hypothetical protein
MSGTCKIGPIIRVGSGIASSDVSDRAGEGDRAFLFITGITSGIIRIVGSLKLSTIGGGRARYIATCKAPCGL